MNADWDDEDRQKSFWEENALARRLWIGIPVTVMTVSLLVAFQDPVYRESEYVYHWHGVLDWLASWPFEWLEITATRYWIRLGVLAAWIYAAVSIVQRGFNTIGVPPIHGAPWYVSKSSVKTIPTLKKPSLVDELERLADLRNRGVLSREEFEQQKAKLLESD